MTNIVPRPIQVDPDGTMDTRYWLRDDPLAAGPQGPQGPQGDPGPQGVPGPQGLRGDDGQSVRIRWIVPNTGGLPSVGVDIGDGALVGASTPYTLYVYTNNPTPQWNDAGTISMGPKGDPGDPGVQGIPGPPGPQPSLAGTGIATTAARSDHNHDSTYSPVTHNHDSAYAAKSTEGRLGRISGSGLELFNRSYLDFTDGISLVMFDGWLPSARIDWGAVARASHNHSASNINSGQLSADRLPNIDASKITSGVFPWYMIPQLNADKIEWGQLHADRIPGLNANKITAGTFSKSRIPQMSLNEMFPTNKSTSGTRLFRIAPGNDHSVIRSTPSGTSVHDTGMRQSTDESWGYVYMPNWGFGWIQASGL